MSSSPKLKEISILTRTVFSPSPEYIEIENSINTYLLRNPGAASDFSLIKDIVDRNTDAIDEEVNNLLPLPLYLGLMGTMLGIIIGLFFIPSISIENFVGSGNSSDNVGIDILLSGVKIAMIASFCGLLLTTVLSGFVYKNAKTKAEKRKNEYFTYIQTELLPTLNQNATSSIFALQRNLNDFNSLFESNIQNFNTSLSGVLKSLDSQVVLMNDLKEIDVVTLAKLNVNVMKELRTSAKEFEKFNQYLSQLDMFVSNAMSLNKNISNQLDRTIDIENIARFIETNIRHNETLIIKFDQEIKQITDRKGLIDKAILQVDGSFQKALTELESHTNAKIKDLESLTITAQEKFSKIVTDYSSSFNDLKKLEGIYQKISSVEGLLREQNQQAKNKKEQPQILPATIGAATIKIPKSLTILGYTFFSMGIALGLYYSIMQIFPKDQETPQQNQIPILVAPQKDSLTTNSASIDSMRKEHGMRDSVINAQIEKNKQAASQIR